MQKSTSESDLQVKTIEDSNPTYKRNTNGCLSLQGSSWEKTVQKMREDVLK